MKYLSNHIDRNLPYCVYITIYKGNQLPPFYIGYVKLSRIIRENYRGSLSQSKIYGSIWKREIKQNIDLFKIFIVKTFSTREEAAYYESYIQTKLDVVKNSLYLNRCIYKNGHLVGGYGSLSQEHKIKLSNSKLGKNNPQYGKKTRPQEHIDKHKASLIKFYQSDRGILKRKKHSQLISKLNVDRKITTETRDKFRNSNHRNCKIIETDVNGEFIKTYVSYSEVARELKLPLWKIRQIVSKHVLLNNSYFNCES